MVESFFYGKHMEDSSNPLMLLSGPPSCGKTSLLFNFAYNAAQLSVSDNDPLVVFICKRHKLQSGPLFLSQGVNPSSDTFGRIKMKYLDDYEGIKRYFAAFHLYDKFPAAVIVDDFGDFFDERSCQERYRNARGRDLAMLRVLALCHNAIMHANKSHPCKLLLSDTHHGDSPRLLFMYKRWIPSIFTIKGGDGSGSYLLINNASMRNENSDKKRVARYSLALQYLCLEEIVENEELDKQ